MNFHGIDIDFEFESLSFDPLVLVKLGFGIRCLLLDCCRGKASLAASTATAKLGAKQQTLGDVVAVAVRARAPAPAVVARSNE